MEKIIADLSKHMLTNEITRKSISPTQGGPVHLSAPYACFAIGQSHFTSLFCLHKIVPSLLSNVGYMLSGLPPFLIAHLGFLHESM